MKTIFRAVVLACLSFSFTAQGTSLVVRQGNATSSAFQNTTSSTDCAPVHIIVVRASTEPPSQGIIGTLATLVTTAVSGSNVEWIRYPAVLQPYNISSFNGTETTTTQLESYAKRCSNSKIVMMGYSQGAHVLGDVLCGGGGNIALGPSTPPVAQEYKDKVVAVIQMGDPRFMPNQSFDAGTSRNMGIFPRADNISCSSLASKIQSYCDVGDPFCDRGNVPAVHLNYTQKYNKAAFDFVMSKLSTSMTTNSSSSSNASNSSSSGNGSSNTPNAGKLSSVAGKSLALTLFACSLVLI